MLYLILFISFVILFFFYFDNNKKENFEQKCSYTSPYMYISNSITFPPPWLIKSYKNLPLPQSTNLQCYNNSLCKSS